MRASTASQIASASTSSASAGGALLTSAPASSPRNLSKGTGAAAEAVVEEPAGGAPGAVEGPGPCSGVVVFGWFRFAGELDDFELSLRSSTAIKNK
jgi:hypothetical protein